MLTSVIEMNKLNLLGKKIMPPEVDCKNVNPKRPKRESTLYHSYLASYSGMLMIRTKLAQSRETEVAT